MLKPLFLFLIISFSIACSNSPSKEELEEMEEVEALIKQDNDRQDSAKEVLDSIYAP